MGDARRFDVFADMIAARIPHRSAPVADVAGGKGFLQAALRRRGFSEVISWDKRRTTAKGRPGYRHALFDYRTAPDSYGLVVGMHPDGGTDHIIRYACKHRVPFVVCPCCVVPSAEPYHGPRRYSAWVAHLARMAEGRGFRVEDISLRMTGCNVALIGFPTVGASA